jgi:hypothetical protein
VKVVDVPNKPPSMAYVRPPPTGDVTVTTASPKPSEQSTVCTGAVGIDGRSGITTLADKPEVQFASVVTLKL